MGCFHDVKNQRPNQQKCFLFLLIQLFVAFHFNIHVLALPGMPKELPSNTQSLSLEVLFLVQWIVPAKDVRIVSVAK